MTKEEALEKIKQDLSKVSVFWHGEIWFYVTKIEPWFNIQTIEQLPEEIKIPKYGSSRLVINEKGIRVHDNFHAWENICLTGFKVRPKSLGILVVCLDNGIIEEVDGPSEWRMAYDELGHIIEFYKKKWKANK